MMFPYPGLLSQHNNATKLVVVGDTQRTSRLEFWSRPNDALQQTLMEEIHRRTPDVFLHLGDLVTWGHSNRHWAHFDQLTASLRDSSTPILPVMGNHDWIGGPFARKQICQRFPKLDEQSWYHFTLSNVGFLMLDSNFRCLGKKATKKQNQWLNKLLKTWEQDDSIRAIVACWHHAPFTNSRHVRPNVASQRQFVASLQKARKAICVFSGHCHAYEHFRIEGLCCLVSGGGGGPLQALETRHGQQRFHDHNPHRESRGFMHFCEVNIQSDSLEFKAVRVFHRQPPAVVDRLTLPFQ